MKFNGFFNFATRCLAKPTSRFLSNTSKKSQALLSFQTIKSPKINPILDDAKKKSLIDLKKTASRTNSDFDKTQVIILSDEHYPIKKNISKAERGFMNFGLKTISLTNDFNFSNKLTELMHSFPGKTLLFIMTQGYANHFRNKESQALDLYGDYIKSMQDHYNQILQLLYHLKKIEIPVSIFITKCDEKISKQASNLLPFGSIYINLRANSVLIHELMQMISITKLKNQTLTAEALLILYLTKVLDYKNPPEIRTENFTLNFNSLLSDRLGGNFSISQKICIYQTLQSLVELSSLDKIIAKIETTQNEEDILPADYGLALAICYIASGKMLQNKLFLESKELPATKQNSFFASKLNSKNENQSLNSQIAETLSLMLGKKINLSSPVANQHYIEISQSQSNETIEAYAELLRAAGLSVEIEETKLALNGPLNLILKKLHFQQDRNINCFN